VLCWSLRDSIFSPSPSPMPSCAASAAAPLVILCSSRLLAHHCLLFPNPAPPLRHACPLGSPLWSHIASRLYCLPSPVLPPLLSAAAFPPSLPLAAIGSLSPSSAFSPGARFLGKKLSRRRPEKQKRMDSTPHCSRVVPHPSTKRAQTALTSVFG
jgi:hypothetical protein